MIDGNGKPMDSRLDVLIAVEDPGAANFVLELPGTFSREGMSCRIVAWGPARGFLLDRGLAFGEPAPGAGPGDILDADASRVVLAGTSQNPRSPVLGLIDEAGERGIPTVGFVDTAADANLRFNGLTDDPLRHAPQWLLVPDKVTEQAFAALGFPGERVRICGHPAYDRVLRRVRDFERLDRSVLREELLGEDPFPRPVWMFAAEHGGDDPRQRRGPGYTLHGRGDSDRRTDIVLEEVLDVAAQWEPRPYVVLRLHPKNTREEFAHYLPEVDFVSSGGDPLRLVWISDVILGLSSMLLMEAALAGRYALSVVPREEEREWCPGVVNGLTPCVHTRQGLREALERPRIAQAAGSGGSAVGRVRDFVANILQLTGDVGENQDGHSPIPRR